MKSTFPRSGIGPRLPTRPGTGAEKHFLSRRSTRTVEPGDRKGPSDPASGAVGSYDLALIRIREPAMAQHQATIVAPIEISALLDRADADPT
jgi:hypothetical protein